jgi:phosphoribosyl 1,2-cyclic phosphodiesterase
MRFSVLASGSAANSTFVEVGETRILIDCGLSARQIGVRLDGLGVDVS